MASRKKAEVKPVEPKPEVITAYKGFDSNMQCRGFQYEIGKTYEHTGKVEACASGFHACEYPLDVFGYYSPASSRFAVVEQTGALSRHDDDSKVASSSLTVKASIDLPGLISAAFEFILQRCTHEKTERATGNRSASSATGDSSASSATGDSSASSATGDSSVSSATGNRSASSATGDSSVSSATGDSSVSSATGNRSASLTTGWYSSSEIKPSDDPDENLNALAIAAGSYGKARAPLGCAIVCVNRDDDGNIVNIRASKVGENGVKPNVWYSLDAAGEFAEVA